jgi:hypothetical protein
LGSSTTAAMQHARTPVRLEPRALLIDGRAELLTP